MKTDEELERAVAKLAQVAHERIVLQPHADRHEALAEVLAQREREQLDLVLSELQSAGCPTLQLEATEDQERRAVDDPDSLHDELGSMVNSTGVRVHLRLKRSPRILRRPTRRVSL